MSIAAPKPRTRWFRLTPDRCLLGLLTVEGCLLLSERLGWFPKGWAVLTAIAAVGVWLLLMLLWYVASLFLRWRFQFSLRSLLVLTLTVAMPFSWLAVRMQEARKQEEALERAVEDGCIYWSSVSSSPTWLRGLLGDELFKTIDRAGISDVADLERLKEFPQVNGLQFFGHRITNDDLARLTRFRRWAALDLSESDLNDAGLEHIAGLIELRDLSLVGTQVTDAGLVHLKRLPRLEHLDLSGTKVTDAGLVHLRKMRHLQWLQLNFTQVTDEGAEKLDQALPSCQIECLH